MLGVIISIIVLIAIDQGLKIAVSMSNLIGGNVLKLWLAEISYTKHYMILFERDLRIASIIVSMVILLLFVKFFLDSYAKKVRSRFNFVPFILIIAGGISNIVDKIARGFVVDYIYVPIILKNTVFNLADIFIFIGACLLIIYYLVKITNAKAEEIVVNENVSK